MKSISQNISFLLIYKKKCFQIFVKSNNPHNSGILDQISIALSHVEGPIAEAGVRVEDQTFITRPIKGLSVAALPEMAATLTWTHCMIHVINCNIKSKNQKFIQKSFGHLSMPCCFMGEKLYSTNTLHLFFYGRIYISWNKTEQMFS